MTYLYKKNISVIVGSMHVSVTVTGADRKNMPL